MYIICIYITVTLMNVGMHRMLWVFGELNGKLHFFAYNKYCIIPKNEGFQKVYTLFIIGLL